MVFITLLFVIFLFSIVILFTFTERKLEDEALDGYGQTGYNRARFAYQQAQHNFNHADPQYIDIAISDLGISENGVNNELRKLRNTGLK